jgi:hypothetical protein
MQDDLQLPVNENFPQLRRVPKEPDKANCQPDLTLIDYLIKSLKQKKMLKLRNIIKNGMMNGKLKRMNTT